MSTFKLYNRIVVVKTELNCIGMNEYEESRRAFLTKLGLTIGASAVTGEKLSAKVLNSKVEFPLTTEQPSFRPERASKWTRFGAASNGGRPSSPASTGGRRVASSTGAFT